MYIDFNRVSSSHTILVAKNSYTGIYSAWYYNNGFSDSKPYGLTDSYREFWL